MTNTRLPPPDYATWLQDVKARIQAARIAVAWAANRELILLCWDLGRGIVEKQELMGWGKSGRGDALRRSERSVSRREGILRQQSLADAPVLYGIQRPWLS